MAETNSIVDYLKGLNQDSSFSARQKLAASNNVQNYTWTAEQNLGLLSTLRSSATTAPTPTPVTTQAPTPTPTPVTTSVNDKIKNYYTGWQTETAAWSTVTPEKTIAPTKTTTDSSIQLDKWDDDGDSIPNYMETDYKRTFTPTKTTSPTNVNISSTSSAPTPDEPTDFAKISTVADWKAKTGGWMENLEGWVEAKYGTVATQEWDKLVAEINGEKYEWIIDKEWNPIKTKLSQQALTDDIFAQFMSWVKVEDTGTPEYSKAKARYEIASKYMSMTGDQLYSAFINNEIGTTLERDLAGNPNLAIAKEKYNQYLVTQNINNESITALNAYNKANWGTITTSSTPNFLETLANNLITNINNSWNDVASFQAYMAENHPDLIKDTKALNEKNKELQILVDQRDGRLDELIKENPWMSLNRATMLAARENKDTNAQIKSMSYEIANLQSNINYQSTMADKEYGYALQQQARWDALNKEQRGYAFDALKTGQSQQFQIDMMEDKRKYEAKHNIPTTIIEVWNKQQLINSQTWELIKEYDMAAWDASEPITQNFAKTWATPDWRQYNASTWEWDKIWTPTWSSNYGADYSTLDFRNNQEIINQYAWEASFKNNNPAWLTWGVSDNLKNLWKNAWIEFNQWSFRPSNEWWSYINFESVQDGLDAYSIALTQAWTNDIFNRLATWVWTVDTESNHRYATDIMAAAWIERWTKFEELSDKELNTLIMTQMSKESPGFLKEIMSYSWPEGADKQYSSLAESWGENILKWVGWAKLSGIQDEDLRNEVNEYLANVKIDLKPWDMVYDKITEQLVWIDSIVDWEDSSHLGFIGQTFRNDTTNESLAEDVSGSKLLLSPIDWATWEKEQFINKIQFVLDWEVLQNLIDVKNQGATFGALSDREWALLQKSASALNAAAIRNDAGKITRFAMSEADFKTALKDLQRTLHLAITPGGQESETPLSDDDLVNKYSWAGTDLNNYFND